VLQRERLRPALEAWWAPRFDRIADWIAAHESQRRAAGAPVKIVSELTGRWRLPAHDFLLTGRADRIECDTDGRLTIVDYKTGQPPPKRDIDAGLALQLPLEAAMARAGSFPGVPQDSEPAETVADQVAAAVARLEALIDAYANPTQCYLSQPRPGLAPRFTDYAQLARVAEWAAVEDEDDGEAVGA
jgi:ATP-dependent helicase/nuclease subunit B